MKPRTRAASIAALGLALAAPGGAHAQDKPAGSPPAPSSAPASSAGMPPPAPPAAPEPSSPSHLRADLGPSVKTLYRVPFYGGQIRAGLGGHYDDGRTRLFAIAQLFYGTDAAALQMGHLAFGVLLERQLGTSFFIGGSADLGFASVSAGENDYVADGFGGSLFLGYDIARVGKDEAFYLQLAPSMTLFTGHRADGPTSFGGALSVGYRQ